MNRITDRDIEKAIERINILTNHEVKPYTMKDGQYLPNAGNYHLDSAYGKVGLQQMMPTGTGTKSIFGLCSKRELYYQLHAFIKGLETK